MADETGSRSRYKWPWIALGAVILGIVLFVLFLSAEARRVKEMRQGNIWSTEPQRSVPATNPAVLSTNKLLAGFEDALSGGDAENGRKIFFEKPEANCAKCHRVGGQGGDTGPALDGVGSKRSREFVLEAMLYPNLHVTTNYESVIVVLKNGQAFSGMSKAEDAATLTINTPDEGLVTVKKDEIQLRQKGVSPMPEGLSQLLSHKDLRDILEYVASLKK